MANVRASIISLLLTLAATHCLSMETKQLPYITSPISPGNAEFDGISMDPDGWMSVGMEVQPVAAVPGQILGALLATRSAGILAGTGPDGHIYKVDRGAADLLFDTPDELVLSLASDGQITLAGTSPSGRIYRLDKRGESECLLDSGKNYVWSLACLGNGQWLAGTGPDGTVLLFNQKGQILESLSLPVHHVLDVQVANGNIWLATSTPGRVYTWSPGAGAPEVKLDVPGMEIHSLVLGDHGDAYVAASTQRVTDMLREGGISIAETPGQPPAPNSDQSLAQSAALESIYRIDRNGVVYPLWNSQELLIDDMIWNDGRLLVACGERGRILALDPRGDISLIAGPIAQPVVTLVSTEDGIVMGVATPQQLLRLNRKRAEQGRIQTPVFDAGTYAQWGLITWEGEMNPAAIGLRTRSGHTQDATDSTWSAWITGESGPDGWRVNSPAARFLQVEIILKVKNMHTPPRIRAISVAARPVNRPPQIVNVIVYPQKNGAFEPRQPSSMRTFYQQLATGVRIEYNIDDSEARTPELQGRWILIRGLRTVSTRAEDPDQDEMRYSFRIRKSSASEWQTIAEHLKDPFFTFDTTPYPDGTYVIQTTVNDSPSNALGHFAEVSRQSAEFIIDNSPPRIEIAKKPSPGEPARAHKKAKVNVQDQLSPLAQVDVSWDGETWWIISPEDGLFDGRGESFIIDPDLVPPTKLPRNNLFLRARDENWNVTTIELPL